MEKGILIIGGGELQIPGLKRARELGFTTHLLDGSEKCIAKGHADFFYPVDINDIKGAAQIAKQLKQEGKIIAVYTQGHDVAYTVAYAAKEAGLPGIEPEAALNCKNKILARQILSKAGVENVRFATAQSAKEAQKAAEKVGFPCYVKPSDSWACKGVTRVVSAEHVEKAFQEALKYCNFTKEVLIEEELKGQEYSVDTVIYKGILYPAGVSDRIFLPKEKYAVHIGSRTPSLLPESVQKSMYEIMDKAAKALGVTDGAFKGDLLVDEKGQVRILEVTARTSGGFDSQLRKPFSFGIDLLKATMDIACGYPLDPVDLIPKWVKWSSTISVIHDSGIITSIEGLEKLKSIKGVKEVYFRSNVGDRVKPLVHSAARTNQIISVADTLEDLLAIEDEIRKTLVITTKQVRTAGINGFGRFGLHLLKYWLDKKSSAQFEITHINDDFFTIQDALKAILEDTYVHFKEHQINIEGNALVFTDASGAKTAVEYTNASKEHIPWIGKPDIFLECSGKNTALKDSEGFLLGTTKLVAISATSWDAHSLIYGFNHQDYQSDMKVVSYGSCTVNAYVPLANWLHTKYGIEDSDANFIHNIPEYKLKDFNTLQRKFCTLEKSGPKLLDFINKDNFTVNYSVVPYAGVSMLDLRFKLKNAPVKEKLIEDLQEAFLEGELKSLYQLQDSDKGPDEHKLTPYSAVFIKDNVRVLNGNLYLYGYFDNENSVNRYFDLINYISNN
ncbi:MAG: ATP-grasp domain-containing protein [bacterium]|nr:ATP-grasp domain-containing protein [bacterium]